MDPYYLKNLVMAVEMACEVSMASYRKFLTEDLEKAISAVNDAKLTIRAASRLYNVPYITLHRHVNKKTLTTKPGRKPKLGPFEEELKTAVTTMVEMGHGASKNDIRDLAASTVQHAQLFPFKSKDEKPSQKWYLGFMKRHNLSLRQPQNMSSTRFKMASEEVKAEFFHTLGKFYEKLIPVGLTANQIFNVDETGVCVVMKSGKVLAPRGSKNVRARTGGERGENVTAVVTVNATGSQILPPTLIFRGQSLNHDLTLGAPEGTVFAYSPKSFIDSELFLEWFKRFVQAIPPTRPVVLLLDGHASHMTFEVIKLAADNDIHMLCFPPHTTHLFQPLDVGVFKGLKSAFSKAATLLMRKNKKKALNRYDVSRVLGAAWPIGVTPLNVQAGFRGSGVWPLNPDAVKLPGSSTNLEKTTSPEPCTEDQGSNPINQDNLSQGAPSQANQISSSSREYGDGLSRFAFCAGTDRVQSSEDPTGQHATLQASCRQPPPTANVPSTPTVQNPVESNLSCPEPAVVKAVRELLQPDDSPGPRSRSVTKTRILTSSEFLAEMKIKENEKKRKEIDKQEKLKAKEKKKQCSAVSKKGKKRSSAQGGKSRKRSKRNVTEDDEEDIDNPDEVETVSQESENEDEELCGTCKKSFQKDFNGEKWIQCLGCKSWFHCACQDLEDFIPLFNCKECLKDSVLKSKPPNRNRKRKSTNKENLPPLNDPMENPRAKKQFTRRSVL